MSLRDRGWGGHTEDVSVGIRSTCHVPKTGSQEEPPYAVEYGDGGFDLYGKGQPLFKILVATRPDFRRLFECDPYSLATQFVRGDFSVEGDLVTAVRFYYARQHRGIQSGFLAALARLGTGRLESWLQTKRRAAKNIRFHYDQSTDFYRQFLDPRMVYSCAYFKDPDQPLEEAQLRKVEHICRKLALQPGDRFLDVGCGWGGLIAYATEEYKTISTGCTLSEEQFDYASRHLAERDLSQKARVALSDYRDMRGCFDKIASVGMFEHIGCRRLDAYFEKLSRLLRPGGLVLNHGITRPEHIRDGLETRFVRRNVFPGGELARLSDVIRSAEGAGFEVLDVENLRPHYALTCQAWVQGLQENMTQCLRYVDRSVHRSWLLALAASVSFFESGRLNVNQLLLYKPGDLADRPFTREYIYT